MIKVLKFFHSHATSLVDRNLEATKISKNFLALILKRNTLSLERYGRKTPTYVRLKIHWVFSLPKNYGNTKKLTYKLSKGSKPGEMIVRLERVLQIVMKKPS